MYERIIILDAVTDITTGGFKTVTLGFFDENGVEQFRVPQVSGKLIANNARKKDSLILTPYGKLKKVEEERA